MTRLTKLEFLEALLDHIPELIRIGGRTRSENERLLSRNIFEVRKRSVDRITARERYQVIKKMEKKATSITKQFQM
jgi:hypothetical protein